MAAASLGACVDLYAVSPQSVGLSVLEPLCNSTGGAMYLYTSADDSALPQVSPSEPFLPQVSPSEPFFPLPLWRYKFVPNAFVSCLQFVPYAFASCLLFRMYTAV